MLLRRKQTLPWRNAVACSRRVRKKVRRGRLETSASGTMRISLFSATWYCVRVSSGRARNAAAKVSESRFTAEKGIRSMNME